MCVALGAGLDHRPHNFKGSISPAQKTQLSSFLKSPLANIDALCFSGHFCWYLATINLHPDDEAEGRRSGEAGDRWERKQINVRLHTGSSTSRAQELQIWAILLKNMFLKTQPLFPSASLPYCRCQSQIWREMSCWVEVCARRPLCQFTDCVKHRSLISERLSGAGTAGHFSSSAPSRPGSPCERRRPSESTRRDSPQGLVLSLKGCRSIINVDGWIWWHGGMQALLWHCHRFLKLITGYQVRTNFLCENLVSISNHNSLPFISHLIYDIFGSSPFATGQVSVWLADRKSPCSSELMTFILHVQPHQSSSGTHHCLPPSCRSAAPAGLSVPIAMNKTSPNN